MVIMKLKQIAKFTFLLISINTCHLSLIVFFIDLIVF